MVRLFAPLISLAFSIGVQCALIAAIMWATQEIGTFDVSGNGIPMSAFPKSTLELDQPIPSHDVTLRGSKGGETL